MLHCLLLFFSFQSFSPLYSFHIDLTDENKVLQSEHYYNINLVEYKHHLAATIFAKNLLLLGGDVGPSASFVMSV